jgi:hypothetical protein
LVYLHTAIENCKFCICLIDLQPNMGSGLQLKLSLTEVEGELIAGLLEQADVDSSLEKLHLGRGLPGRKALKRGKGDFRVGRNPESAIVFEFDLGYSSLGEQLILLYDRKVGNCGLEALARETLNLNVAPDFTETHNANLGIHCILETGVGGLRGNSD